MRSLIIALLIFLNLGSTLMVPLIYLDFEVRNDYISKVLCIERDNPMTVCRGNCYLVGQLNKAMDHQEKSEKITPKEIVFFLNADKQFNITVVKWVIFECVTFTPFSDQFSNSLLSFDIFHPPRLV